MVIRILSLFAFSVGFCQFAWGQSYNQAPPLPTPGATTPGISQPSGGYPNAGYPSSMYPTPDPNAMGPGYAYGPSSMSDAQPYGQEMGYCGDSGGPYYVPPHWAHRWFFWSYWKIKGLPSPWHSPGDMTQHIPYVAEPKNYYYFRPYNWFHLPEQQAEAAIYGTDPRNPYDNRVVFDGLYDGLE